MGDAGTNPPDFDTLYRQIQSLPEGVTGEILDPGVLHTMGRPGKAHRRAQRMLVDGVFDLASWWLPSTEG